MLLLNFSHPLDQGDMDRIKELIRKRENRDLQLDIDHKRFPFHLKDDQPFVKQVQELLDRVELNKDEWQQKVLLIYLPEKSVIAATMIAEINARSGYFPKILRMRPSSSFTKSTPLVSNPESSSSSFRS